MAVQVNNKAAVFAKNQFRESSERVWGNVTIHWVNGEGEREEFKLLAVLMGLEVAAVAQEAQGEPLLRLFWH